jgi:tRNA modification GTPase
MPTYLARLTPPATGAIATLALRGPEAWDVLETLFTPPSRARTPADFFQRLRSQGQPGQFWLGRLGGPGHGGADEVVLALKEVVPVPTLEIHCHGGLQVLALLEETLCTRGAQLCSWEEILTRQTGDPVATAACASLCAAATLRTAAILLDQYHGAWRQTVLEVVSHLQQDQGGAALRQLQGLARWVPLGRHLTTPWRVVVAGAPNVGKSSLINRLAGYARCVVAPTPGTTRDVVTTRVAIDGWPVELVDTAGLQEAPEPLERQGMVLAVAAATEADLCLWLVDAGAPPVWPMPQLPNAHLVINKLDLRPAWDLAEAGEAVRVSAATGAGMDDLCQALSRWLVPEAPPAGAAVPFTASLIKLVEEAHQLCARAQWAEALGLLTDTLKLEPKE